MINLFTEENLINFEEDEEVHRSAIFSNNSESIDSINDEEEEDEEAPRSDLFSNNTESEDFINDEENEIKIPKARYKIYTDR